MTPTTLLVLHLETTPDTRLLPLDPNPEALSKPIHHQVVGLSYLLSRIHPESQQERYDIRRLNTLSLERQEERAIMAEFWRLVDQHQPRVVTWNGRSFAVPVLKQRSLIYGLAAYLWHRTDPRYGYDYRYNAGWHCDLKDLLSDTGASVPLSLAEAAAAIGLPARLDKAFSPGPAESSYAGLDRRSEIAVLTTYILYLRWAYFSTRISARGHNLSIANLVDFLASVRSQRPHLGDFLDGWQESRQPCPLDVPEPEDEPGPQLPESHLRSEDVLP